MIYAGSEAFCERCGTKVGATAPDTTPIEGLLKRVSGRGQRPPDSGLRLCLSCRNYVCAACVNESQGMCQTCAPLPDSVSVEHDHGAVVATDQPAVEVLADDRPARPLTEPVWPALELLARPSAPILAPLATPPPIPELTPAGSADPPPFALAPVIEPELIQTLAPDQLAPLHFETTPALAEREPEPEPVAAPAPVAAEPTPVVPLPAPLPPYERADMLTRIPPRAPLAPRFSPPAARPPSPAQPALPPLQLVHRLPVGRPPALPAKPSTPASDAMRACAECQLPLSSRAGFCRRCGSAQPQVA